MSDAESEQPQVMAGQDDGKPKSDFMGQIMSVLGGGDVSLAMGVVGILVVLILPLPPWLLDVLLTVSFTLSVIILMTTLFVRKPLDFSTFPTVLLIATMLRLSLNLASTRLILSAGHEGPDAAGHVIQAFGGFVMGNNFVIGIIVFAILMIVNFVVITKGAGRIAEVAARFSLDAMPGKQMAIDADLSAGLITEDAARTRRKQVEDESGFFGSMDGAAKFVRGDAIAGLLITFINIIGGMIIGVAQMDMSIGPAADAYVSLTVGDGLVTQIPALIVSTAAGLLVTRAGTVGSTEQAVFGQLSNYPRALGVSSVLILGLGLLPELPLLPFLFLATATGGMAWQLSRSQQTEEEIEAQRQLEKVDATPVEEPITTALAMDLLRLELGYGLLPLINDQTGYRLTDQIKALRRQLAGDMGFVMPSVRILDNMQLPPNAYVIRIKEVEAGQGELRPGMLLAMDPQGGKVAIPGEPTTEPTFGLAATWIENDQREEAAFRGYTVVDPATVVTTHLTEVLKDNMPELLSYAETQKLLDDLPQEHQKLIADLVPSQISVSAIQRILQNLLAERVSIRDLPTILEGISEAAAMTQNIVMITEHVRTRLARQISYANNGPEDYIPLITLSPDWEQNIAESIVVQGDDRQLSMAPSRLQEFIALVRDEFDEQARLGEVPVLLTSPMVRPFVRSVIERFRPSTVVMSQNEIFAKARIRTVGQVGGGVATP
jgi:flagellar biosynthesis protein FlhA